MMVRQKIIYPLNGLARLLLGGLLPWCLERARSRILQIYLTGQLDRFLASRFDSKVQLVL
jgi:hypothetical protein